MGNESDVATRIRKELAAYLKRDVQSVLPAYSLRDDLGLDSMATIELLYRIEEAFDLQIPDEDLQQLNTVADVISYEEGRLAPPEPSASAKSSGKRSNPKKRG